MITRREMLTGSAAALTTSTIAPAKAEGTPAVIAAPASPAPRPRARRTGGTRLKFDMYTGLDDEYDEEHMRNLRVLILARADWDAREESMLKHGWSGQYIDDGRRVLAVKLAVPRWRRRRVRMDAPCAETLAVMRRLRGAVLRGLESIDDVRFLSVQDGGDGQVAFQVGIDGLGPDGYIRMEFTNDEGDVL